MHDANPKTFRPARLDGQPRLATVIATTGDELNVPDSVVSMPVAT
jgi:hypothetical protein